MTLSMAPRRPNVSGLLGAAPPEVELLPKPVPDGTLGLVEGLETRADWLIRC